MKLVNYKHLLVNLKKKIKQRENKIKELEDEIKKIKTSVNKLKGISCQKCFTKLQTMKNTKSKIKPKILLTVVHSQKTKKVYSN